jgi:hypothetical protein
MALDLKTMALNKIQEIVLTLAKIRHQIEITLSAYEKGNKSEEEKYVIYGQILISICSFLDEWKRFESLRNMHTEAQYAIEIAVPAIKRIKKWPGMSKIRNSFLAHPSRDSKKQVVWAWDLANNYNFPTTYAEIILLGKCCVLACRAVIDCNKDQYNKGVAEVKKEKQPIDKKGISTTSELEVEYKRIDEEMQKIVNDINNRIQQSH